MADFSRSVSSKNNSPSILMSAYTIGMNANLYLIRNASSDCKHGEGVANRNIVAKAWIHVICVYSAMDISWMQFIHDTSTRGSTDNEQRHRHRSSPSYAVVSCCQPQASIHQQGYAKRSLAGRQVTFVSIMPIIWTQLDLTIHNRQIKIISVVTTARTSTQRTCMAATNSHNKVTATRASKIDPPWLE
jgi:hypothetical protein